jgi:hypothetical protein
MKLQLGEVLTQMAIIKAEAGKWCYKYEKKKNQLCESKEDFIALEI